MPAKTARKNAAAVALGRKGGKRGGPARAAKLTPEQRSESARKAVQARWAKRKAGSGIVAVDTSDNALLALLQQLKTAKRPAEVRQLSGQIERVIFHKQFKST